MPDPRTQLRRFVGSRLVRRALTHSLVLGLVASATAIGIFRQLPADPSLAETALGNLAAVGRVLAGGEEAANQAGPTLYQLVPDPNQPDPLPRDAIMVQPTPVPTALPTPVAPPPPPPEPTPRPQVAARPAGSGQLSWPVAGTITQYYSAAHLALDIAAPTGSTVVAADGGVVTWAGWRNNGGGLVIQIDHGNGISTVYNHLGSVWVSAGQAVGRGEAIAAVGCTGNCTGPHVHFEVIVGGVIVNPLRYL